jgi:hypothetical protein
MQSAHPHQAPDALRAVPDDELLRRLAALLRSVRHTEAELVAHIGEVDARRLYAREACPSMWSYCTERLHLSGAEAYLRIAAARAAREHPVLLEMLAEGRMHLTAIALLAPHLTSGNREGLLRRATHKSKREVEEIVAEIAPRPDAPARIRKLSERKASAAADVTLRAALHSPILPASVSLTAAFPPSRSQSPLQPDPQSPLLVDSQSLSQLKPQAPLRPDLQSDPHLLSQAAASSLRLDEVLSSGSARVALSSDHRERLATIEPLSPGRHKVQFTASTELRGKLERLQALMRCSVHGGDLAAVIEVAVTEKLERLEARRFGRTKSPRKTVAPTARPDRVTGSESDTAGQTGAGRGTLQAVAAVRPETGGGVLAEPSVRPETRCGVQCEASVLAEAALPAHPAATAVENERGADGRGRSAARNGRHAPRDGGSDS